MVLGVLIYMYAKHLDTFKPEEMETVYLTLTCYMYMYSGRPPIRTPMCQTFMSIT